ncbi:MAG TPA: hypothetical protein VK645_01310 [Chitinophagaceae bacterium]|nr:hypothetical protein [Chitinophagaceae bacterium]
MANKTNINRLLQNKITTVNVIYFSFTFLYFFWVLSTYRNIVHMDMMNILSTKVKDFYENKLTIRDFVYQPLFPGTISITFTLLNSYFFHLNTVIETACGSFFLMTLGYKYLTEINSFIAGKKVKIFFTLLISFLIYGLHKWEAAFTSCFSFAVFFNLCICFFNYFFAFKYAEASSPVKKDGYIAFFILSNILVIFEAPAYFYSYMLAVLILLFLVKRYKIIELNAKRWRLIFNSSLFLLTFTVFITTYLAKHPAYAHYVSNLSIGNFLNFFAENPLWVIKFYLITHSGAFFGEAHDYTEVRALGGFVIFTAYVLAIYHVVKTKDKRLLVPAALIFYNIISCGLITISRYIFNDIGYGGASRYTAFNLSGVLGLATILFFIIFGHGNLVKKYLSWSLLILIVVGYLYVDRVQWKISPARTTAFKKYKVALLTGEHLEWLQAEEEASRQAIEVLKKYKLNVYYEKFGDKYAANMKLKEIKQIAFISGTPAFDKLEKNGFYDNENGITWTNGKASVFFDQVIQTKDSLLIQLDTYMPPVCSTITPRLSFIDEYKKEYLPVRTIRKEDQFYFFFNGLRNITIQKINIVSDTINAYPDKRVLSFPFKSLTIKDAGL